MKKKVYLYILVIGALNLVLFQNCSKQVFDKPIINEGPKTQRCEFPGASINTVPGSDFELNEDITYSLTGSAFENISWEFFKDSNRDGITQNSERISSLSTNAISPSVQFSEYGVYIVEATLERTLEDSALPCSDTISYTIEILDPNTPSTACLVTSDQQNGTQAKPWLINSCECFQEIETNPRNSQKTHYFSITENLNCNAISNQNGGQGFVSIKYFKGHIEGNNKIVTDLKSERTNASVFYGDFNGSIKNITFQNLRLVSLAANSDAAFHLVDRLAIYSHDPITAENINLQNVYIEAGYEAAGFAERLIGNISNIRVSGTIKGIVASGVIGEIYSLRNFYPSTQFSVVDNAEFNGTLSGNFLAGIAGFNLGTIKNSKANITVSETKQNLQFDVAGITLLSCAGALVENCESSGTVNLDYSVNENSLRSYLFIYGSLVGSNTRCSSANGLDTVSGTVTNSRSSIVANIRVAKTPGSTNQMYTYINNLIGYDPDSSSSSNVYSGQLTFTKVGFTTPYD